MAIKWTKKPINTDDLIRCAEDALRKTLSVLQKLGVSVHVHPQYYVTGQRGFNKKPGNINKHCVSLYILNRRR